MTANQTPDPIKVGFFDQVNQCMVEVEEWDGSIFTARAAAVSLSTMYKGGRHRMPSPIWCVWNKNDYASIFLLDEKPRDEAFMNHVLKMLV
jgi:hypothetical protein